MLRRLVPVFPFVFALAPGLALAQPAVPAVPPLPGARPAAAAPAPAPAPARVAAPVADPDAPPTSDGPSAPAAAAQAAADAPPTSDPPTSAPAPAAAAPAAAAAAGPAGAATATAAVPAAPVIPPLVEKNFPLTPEGNARFLATYGARPDVKRLDGGVLYRVLRPADPKSNGPLVRGDTVTVTYRGWLIDGTNFDQTKPGTPALFTLNGVIPGWRTALLKMKVGDLWEIVVPADQAYGEEGRPGRIPPNQVLVFVVSLAKVEYAG